MDYPDSEGRVTLDAVFPTPRNINQTCTVMPEAGVKASY